jgi:hypothetical protein
LIGNVEGYRNYSPSDKAEDENVEQSWGPLSERIESLESFIFEEFCSARGLFLQASGMFSDLD